MLYEDQAGRFDKRAGVPAEACAAIAEVLAEIVALEPGQTWLEIGAGTGALSLALVRHPIRYVGFDRSPAMLAVFRGKLAQEGLQAQLEVADGNGPWPVEDGSIAVIFSARAMHHLDAAGCEFVEERALAIEQGHGDRVAAVAQGTGQDQKLPFGATLPHRSHEKEN